MIAITILGGFLLIDYEYQDNLEQARYSALDKNKTLYAYISAAEEMLGRDSFSQYSLERFIRRLSDESGNEILLGEFAALQEQLAAGQAEKLENGQYIYVFISRDNQTFIQVTSRYNEQYIINYYDISDIMEHRDQNYILYRNVIIGASIIIAVILYLFSWYITRPLTKVTKMAEKLSSGEYAVRIDSSYRKMKSHEVEQLGSTLNQLASHTESYIQELRETAQKKEAFMGNFTHEMKTPMTSIIGYADLLRTYDLEPDKRREYSNYIYAEGKRVEKLAFNLLQLLVMEKKEFPMEPIRTEELFKQLESEVRFLGEKYNAYIHLECESGMIRGEKSLLSVAIKNLIDNACKASQEGGEIWVRGKKCGENYRIVVIDKGHGIAKEELEFILEPFYMTDKSRARQQGGAGLGLSLCSKIVQKHEGEMKITSTPRKGTVVTLLFKCWENGGEENEKE